MSDAVAGFGKWTLILIAIGLVVGAGSALSWTFRSVDQPLAFNHRLHVEDVGADCTDCHLYALTGVRATIPNIQSCVDCHPESLTESAEEARLIEFIEAGQPIPWKKVYWVPDHVYFSHRRHAALGEIACGVCHGPVGARDQPVTRALVEMSMDACMNCHEETDASNDCIACHR